MFDTHNTLRDLDKEDENAIFMYLPVVYLKKDPAIRMVVADDMASSKEFHKEMTIHDLVQDLIDDYVSIESPHRINDNVDIISKIAATLILEGKRLMTYIDTE